MKMSVEKYTHDEWNALHETGKSVTILKCVFLLLTGSIAIQADRTLFDLSISCSEKLRISRSSRLREIWSAKNVKIRDYRVAQPSVRNEAPLIWAMSK